MDAGYAVGADTLGAPSSIQRSGEVSGIRSMPVPSGVSATAAGDKTELDASGQGSGVLSVQAPPAQSRGKWVAFAAGIALVAGAGYVFTKPDATPAPSTPSVADTPKPKPQEPTATPSEASAAAPSASAAPASTVVKLDVSTTPPGADIHEGETKLGQAGTPMTLPRGDAPLTLRVTKSGFQPGSITVTPSKDLSVSVTLVAAVKKPIMRGKPAAAPVKPVRPHSDLEGLD